MTNLENEQPHQPWATPAGYYYRLFSEYVLSQHPRLANGKLIPWISEDLNADTDQWITRAILIQRHSRMAGRGNYHNHSGFADPPNTGLIGLRPREGSLIVLHPLLPADAWSWFCLRRLAVSRTFADHRLRPHRPTLSSRAGTDAVCGWAQARVAPHARAARADITKPCSMTTFSLSPSPEQP